MISKILLYLHDFSVRNWWVYIILSLTLILVFVTSTGNIYEILGVFLVYFCAELCMMAMVEYMHKNEMNTASLFQLVGNIIFTLLFLYHFLVNGQAQYFLSSPIFILGAVKSTLFHYFQVDFTFINSPFIVILGLSCFISYYYFHISDLSMQVVLQFSGMILFASYLVMKNINTRFSYFWGFVGICLIILGSILGIYNEYIAGAIYGVTLTYFLMPLTVLLVYAKDIRKYL